VLRFSKFIDFDKNKSIFYNNIYLDEYKIVVKMPLTKKEPSQEVKEEVIIEKFDITKYVYLLAYE